MPKIIIIGGGITGISSAIFLLREGADVTIIDPLTPGDEGQASYGNAGVIACASVLPLANHHPILDITKMLLSRNAPLFLRATHAPKMFRFGREFIKAGHNKYEASLNAIANLTRNAVSDHKLLKVAKANELIRHGGFSFVYKSSCEFEREKQHFEEKRAAGFAVKYIENTRLEEIDDGVSDQFRYAAICENHAWIANPSAYLRALYDEFLDLEGVHIKESVSRLGTGEVNEIKADKIIICAGAYSAKILKMLGKKIPLEGERGYHIFFENTKTSLKMPMMHGTAQIVATPMAHGIRFAGIAEYGNLDGPPSTAPMAFLKRHVFELYPELKGLPFKQWMGRRPTFPDSLPMIGTLKSHTNIICAFGGQHVGMTIGPKLGMLTRDLALGREVDLDLSPYSPERFT